MRRKSLLAVLLFAFSLASFGQSSELGVVAGGVISPDGQPSAGIGSCTITNPNCGAPVQSRTAFAVEGVFAHRVINAHLASLYFEFPIVGTPNRTLRQVTNTQDFSSIFFTPGVKLRLEAPGVKPFVSVGGGFAHFSASGSSSTEGAFQVGGGFDFTTPIPLIALRAEAREFYTGLPSAFRITPVNRNNVFVGGGIVLRF